MAVRARRNTIVWKKVQEHTARAVDDVFSPIYRLAKLLIKKGTWLRTSIEAADKQANHCQRKNRTASAKVLGFYSFRGKLPLKVEKCRSSWSPSFIYRVGQTVKPKSRFSKRATACASGIHFYYRRRDAENH